LIAFKKNLDVSTLFISLEELERDESRLIQLSYPSPDRDYAWMILSSLKQLRADAILYDSMGTPVMLGKGFRNIVLACLYRGEVAAAKIRRIDYMVKNTEREAAMLAMANKVGVGPRLFGHFGPVLIMELVEGKDLTSWLYGISEKDREEAVRIVSDLLRQCFMLDRAWINHDELSDASKHVLRTGRGAVILDFGSARITPKPSNLTSIINYLFHGPIRRVSLEILGMRKPSNELLRRYKSLITWETFGEIHYVVTGLECSRRGGDP